MQRLATMSWCALLYLLCLLCSFVAAAISSTLMASQAVLQVCSRAPFLQGQKVSYVCREFSIRLPSARGEPSLWHLHRQLTGKAAWRGPLLL